MGEKIIIYTDGAVIGNGKENSKCGWAVKLMYGDAVLFKSGSAIGFTNNQAEMTAVLNALQSVTDYTIPVELYSDSQYVIKTLNGEFRVGMNVELWEKIFKEVNKFSKIEFKWVKGHSVNKHNNEVDELALKEANHADKRNRN